MSPEELKVVNKRCYTTLSYWKPLTPYFPSALCIYVLFFLSLARTFVFYLLLRTITCVVVYFMKILFIWFLCQNRVTYWILYVPITNLYKVPYYTTISELVRRLALDPKSKSTHRDPLVTWKDRKLHDKPKALRTFTQIPNFITRRLLYRE